RPCRRPHPRQARAWAADLQSRPWHHAGGRSGKCRAAGCARAIAWGRQMNRDDAGAKSGLRAGIALAAFVAGAVALHLLADNAYLWFKALHVMAVIAWMAGLFYLPRLFIYHHDKAP